MKKLVLFGDSLFARISKSNLLSLESRLPEYDVYNCAVGGWDTNDCVKKAPYIASLKPDILMLSVGSNDSAPWKQVDIQLFESNLAQVFKSFSGSKIIFFLPPPVNEAILSEDAKRKNRKALTDSLIKSYYDVAKQSCEANQITFLDSWQVFKPLMDKGEDYHVDDGIHFSDMGYELLFDELAKLV